MTSRATEALREYRSTSLRRTWGGGRIYTAAVLALVLHQERMLVAAISAEPKEAP